MLSSFVDKVASESHLRVESDLGDGFVRLRTEEAERRQAAHDVRSSEDIVIELLRNSRDAHARNIFLAFSKSGSKRTIVVVDDGDGIPQRMQEKVFEPRVTSKLDSMHLDKWGVHGRGMALYSVKVNSEEARVCLSEPGRGCALLAQTDLGRVSEKADQSSFPTFSLKDNRRVSIKGPRNILRTAVEFALEHRSSISVYAGSVSEIAAALYNYGLATVSSVERAFSQGMDEVPVTKRLAFARDCQEFSRISCELGLEMSERSARRIMDGEVAPAPELKELVAIADDRQPAPASKRPSKPAATSRVHISQEDLNEFRRETQAAFAELAQRYYLLENPDIVVQRRGNTLHISIPLENNPN